MFEFDATLTKEAQQTVRVADLWNERIEHVADYVVLECSSFVLEQMLRRLPKTGDVRSYRRSLQLAKVTGLPSGFFAYAIRSDPKARKMKSVDAPKTALYVRAKRRMRRPNDGALVLERFSPWTMNTIPFIPTPQQAKLVSRKVRSDEATRIEEMRNKDKRKWQTELSRVGVRVSSRSNDIKTSRRARAVPDAAFEAIRLEFGVGVQPYPHWRPALTRLMKYISKMAQRHPELLRYMTDPNAKMLRGRKVGPRVTTRQAQKYVSFQKKLGISLTGG